MKQPFASVLQKRCSEEFRNINMKIPVLKPLSNKVTGLLRTTFL